MARSTMNGDGDGTKPLSQIAYDALRSMILSGEVKPGERLRERELARRVQVSRTPLREALGRLERDGLAVKDRKSTRLNSSHPSISYAVFCLKKKTTYHFTIT